MNLKWRIDSVCNVALQIVLDAMDVVRSPSLRAARLQSGVVIQALGFNHRHGVGGRRAIHVWGMLKQRINGLRYAYPSYVCYACLAFLVLSWVPSYAQSTIPFVGCSSSGRYDIPAPIGSPIKIDLPPKIASRLALYAGDSLILLGPRGWQCVGVNRLLALSLSIYPKSDSSDENRGENLSVYTAADLGEIGQINSFGARYFGAILRLNIADTEKYYSSEDVNGSEPLIKRPFVVPKFHDDLLEYQTRSFFKFTTPANTVGLGDLDLLYSYPYSVGKPVSLPTYGIAAITRDKYGTYSLYVAKVRLPNNLAYLSESIQNFVYNCVKNETPIFCSIDVGYPSKPSE